MSVASKMSNMFNQLTVGVTIIFLCFNIAQADNSTDKYVPLENILDKQRLPKFLTFNTQDGGDVTVDLEFAVPFISIPVKKSINNLWDLAKGGANINTGAILLAGVMIFGAITVVPLFSTIFSKDSIFSRKNIKDADSWNILSVIDKALLEHNIDTSSCVQRTMCWVVKNSANKMKNGQAVSHDMIINGIVTNDWVNKLVEGSAMQTAMAYGLKNINCSAQYKDCKITKKAIHALINKLIHLIS